MHHTSSMTKRRDAGQYSARCGVLTAVLWQFKHSWIGGHVVTKGSACCLGFHGLGGLLKPEESYRIWCSADWHLPTFWRNLQPFILRVYYRKCGLLEPWRWNGSLLWKVSDYWHGAIPQKTWVFVVCNLFLLFCTSTARLLFLHHFYILHSFLSYLSLFQCFHSLCISFAFFSFPYFNLRPQLHHYFLFSPLLCRVQWLCYGLIHRGIVVRLLLRTEIYFPPKHPDWLWGPPCLQWVPRFFLER